MGSRLWCGAKKYVTGDWDFSGIVIPSVALDLSCTAGNSVYALRENDVLALPHIRRCAFCNKDFSATLEMTMRAKRYRNFAALRSFDSVLLFQISHFFTYDVFLRSG